MTFQVLKTWGLGKTRDIGDIVYTLIDEKVLAKSESDSIEDFIKALPFDLSGGQKRRVAIAGVIAMEPEVLILDEPTAGLDPKGREEILGNIQDYRKKHNATIMMVSHSMNDVARLTERLLVLCGSKIAMDGPPEEVFTRADELLEMGLDIPDITRVFLRLKQMGLPLEPVYTMDQAVSAVKMLKEGK